MDRYEVVIAEPAEQDINANFAWWRDNRSTEQAERWLGSIYPAIESLSRMPKRCARVAESAELGADLRELLFGIGRKPTHRVVFEILGPRVRVLRVLHVAQRSIRDEDLP